MVFGEGNHGNVDNLLRQIAARRFLMVGRGKNIKSMAYVGNIAAFLVHVLAMGPGSRIFNYADGPNIDTSTLVATIRSCLNQREPLRQIPKPVAFACAHLLDAVAGVTGRKFAISAIRVRKFCESTQFRAGRVSQSRFIPPYTLSEGLARTIQFEFPTQAVIRSQAAADSRV